MNQVKEYFIPNPGLMKDREITFLIPMSGRILGIQPEQTVDEVGPYENLVMWVFGDEAESTKKIKLVFLHTGEQAWQLLARHYFTTVKIDNNYHHIFMVELE